jgi:serine/threonine-protein kinase
MPEELTHTAGPGRDGAFETNTPLVNPPGYELNTEIGRGGMGVVYRARDTALDRDVAVKLLAERYPADSPVAQRFLSEARITGQLQHPGIPAIHQVGTLADGRPFLAMKLIKGSTLETILKRRPDPSAERGRLLAIFEAVCQAVGYAHAHRVIHRDLKPANIMVGAFGEVQVMDWGLAKVLPQSGSTDENATRTRDEASVIRTSRSVDLTNSESSLTQAGSVLGTPAYMAPEQARGDVDLVDERADLFGLGAILCEILTGQPPFTGKGAEAQRKAQTARLDDAHARLDGCGAEPDLVALAKRCLSAEPWDRPRDARQLALTLTAYEHSVAQRLRQAELDRAAAEARTEEEARTRQMAEAKAEEEGNRAKAEARTREMAEAKALEERKRRHVTLALAAAVLALVMIGGSGASWWMMERRAAEQDVHAALEDSAKYSAAGRWPEARAALEQVEGRLGTWGLETMRKRVHQAKLDAELVAELDEVRLLESEAIAAGSRFDLASSNERYRAAFAKYGIDLDNQTSTEAAMFVAQSDVHVKIVEGLHAWLRTMPILEQNRLLAVLDEADPDVWRRAFRTAAVTKDTPKLRELAIQQAASAQPPAVQFWLAAMLRQKGGIKEAEALLRQGQQQHPADFWLNYQMGETLLFGARMLAIRPYRPKEAVGYLRAAVALRTTSVAARVYLADALAGSGDLSGAIAECRHAIDLNPQLSSVHTQLGRLLQKAGDLDGAIAEHRRAISLEPRLALPHNNLGSCFLAKRDMDGAIAEYGQALAIDPKLALVHKNLGVALASKGNMDRAIAEYGQALEIEPMFTEAIVSLADGLRAKGDLDGAIAQLRRAAVLDPKDSMTHSNLGALLCDFKREYDAAIAEFRQAIALDPTFDEGYFNLANALKYKGDLNEAIAAYRHAISLNPKYAMTHNNLADVLANAPDPKFRDPVQAVVEARKAKELAPNVGLIWGTLGEASYRAGQWQEAIAALKHSLPLSNGGDSEAFFFLAMAHERASHNEEARKWYQKGVDWMYKHAPRDPGLLRFRAEAAGVLGVKQ